uniref:pre-mRNA-splicing factor CWC21-like n=1 Tax=Erigeron canadensis TaxID=72917 RepID=UPI001CB8CD34|nr:pre-mRNA-splicing factor CWC21-like [Erigeron canadensis]
MSAIDDLEEFNNNINNNNNNIINNNNNNSFHLYKEMELSSPQNGYQELSDILKENEPCGTDELLPSCIVTNDQNPGEYVFGNLDTNNDSMPNDLPYYGFCESPQRIFSPLQDGFGDNVVLGDDQFVIDDERLCSDYLSRSPFQVEAESIHNNINAEVSEQMTESSPKKDVTEEQVTEDKLASTSNGRMVDESFIGVSSDEPTNFGLVTAEADYEVSDILTENVEFMNHDLPRADQHSPNVSPQVPKPLDQVNPKAIASPQQVHEQPYSFEVNSPKDLSPPEDFNLSIPSNDKKNHESMNTSEQGEIYINDDSARNPSASPRSHHSNGNHRTDKRSVSPSRGKETSSRHRRDHRERSRSRSPRRRQFHRRSRSPRRRYFPSHRSPSSSYHSRYRSPKQKQWSPPHNRSTGLGKPGRNLFVAGFSFLTTERDLERKFSRFGRVRDVRIVRNKWSGDSRGFGFLTLERDKEADAAIKALDKTEWNGRVILVEKSKPQS